MKRFMLCAPLLLAACADAVGPEPSSPAFYESHTVYGTVQSACSGGPHNTCASIQTVVDGAMVYLRIRNTNGGATAAAPNGYRGATYYEVRVRGLPAGVVADAGSLSMYGTYYSGGKLPSRWVIAGTNGDGQGIVLRNSSGSSRSNGLASNCATTPKNLVPRRTNSWMNPTCGSTNVTDPGMTSGWVRLAFRVAPGFVPTADMTVVLTGLDEDGAPYQVAVPLVGP